MPIPDIAGPAEVHKSLPMEPDVLMVGRCSVDVSVGCKVNRVIVDYLAP